MEIESKKREIGEVEMRENGEEEGEIGVCLPNYKIHKFSLPFFTLITKSPKLFNY